MTMDNLKYVILLNNMELLNRMRLLKDSIDSITGTDIIAIKKDIDEITELIETTKKNLEELNNTSIENIQNQINTINTNIESICQSITELAREINESLSSLETNINNTIDTKVSEINESIQTNVSNINKTINDNVEEINNKIDSSISNINSEISDILSSIQELSNSLSELTTVTTNHVDNTVIHVTQDDKDLWNGILQNAKDYAKTLFDGVVQFKIIKVDELPEEDIQEMAIYFVRNTDDKNLDYYDEYMYINSAWETIGHTYVNLEPYLLKEEFENSIRDYLLISNFNNIISQYTDTQSLNTLLGDYVTKIYLTANYVSKQELQDVLDNLSDYSTTEQITKLLSDYVTKESLDKKLETLHEHGNKNVLDKLSENLDGNLLYNGKPITTNNSGDSSSSTNSTKLYIINGAYVLSEYTNEELDELLNERSEQ